MSAALKVCRHIDTGGVNKDFLEKFEAPEDLNPRDDDGNANKTKQISLVASSQPKEYIIGPSIEGTTLLECEEKYSGKEVKCQMLTALREEEIYILTLLCLSDEEIVVLKLVIAEVVVEEKGDSNERTNTRRAKNKVILAAVVVGEAIDERKRKNKTGDKNKDKLSNPRRLGQLEAHMRVSKSVHIAFPIDLFLESGSQFLVFDKGHGNMHAHIKELRQMMPELDAKALFFQMVEAVADCHSAGIILNDMKLRRFIFSNIGKTNLCIENLDGCVLLDPGESDDKSYTKKGNPFYVSPEAIRAGRSGHYNGKPSDVWSLGVMMYTMLCGKYPFHDVNPIAHLSKVTGGKYSTPDVMSRSARCLIAKMLKRDPQDRLTAREILHHPWFDYPVDPKIIPFNGKIKDLVRNLTDDDQRVPDFKTV